MKHHYKNIQLKADGFDTAYFERRLRISRTRAKNWTSSRVAFELKHPVLYSKFVISLLAVSPVALCVVWIWSLK